MADGANWYVVHTYSGYENKVKANIEKTIENRKLQDQIFEVTVPMQDVIEIKNGARKQVQKKQFPGYVLINMIMNDSTWYVVRNTRGVTGFVGPGSKPVPLSEEEIKPLIATGEKIIVSFEVGDLVTAIAEGSSTIGDDLDSGKFRRKGDFIMAKKIDGYIKLQIEAGKASPAPPVGPALGQYGVNIVQFTKEFNARTADQMGMIIPVVITVYADRSFTFITKTPPAPVLIKKACKIQSGSGEPNRKKVATITKADLQQIAETKMPDLNAASLEAAMSMIAGTCRSMGVLVEE